MLKSIAIENPVVFGTVDPAGYWCIA